MKIYAVGGSVRDELMNRPVHDEDFVVVGSTHDEMISLNYERVGSAFPVYLKDGKEYALARTEVKTGEGYLGFTCAFGPEVTLEEDLGRRDLRINSIAKDLETGQIIDPYNGRADIENRVLRHTSDAFAEDPLRVIRLARFYARFYNDRFTVAPGTVQLACKVVDSGEMDKLSFERYWAELHKVMSEEDPHIGAFLQALRNFGALEKTAFFADVYGDITFYSKEALDQLMGDYEKRLTMVAWGDPDLAVAILVALFENKAPLAHTAVPTRVSRLVNHTRTLQLEERGGNGLYNILAATRSLCEPTEALKDFQQFLRVMDLHFADISVAQELISEITAAPFMHLSGAEIGKALKEARLKKLIECFGDW